MFSEGFRQVPRKLIKLTIENPTALWLYCYLVDKMDDRVEMECLINVTLTAKIIGIPKTTLRSIMYFLADIGAISITTGRKGYLVKAINYQNNQSVKAWIENGSKTDRNLDRNLDRKLQSEDISIKDILGDTADIVGSSFGSSFGSNSDRKSDRTGGVLVRGKKREKNILADDMLTPVFLAPQQAESSTPKKRKQAKPKVPSKSGILYKSYSEEFLAAYGLAPLKWNAAENTSAGKLIDEVGEEISIEMVKRYFKSNDKYVKSAKHPFLHLYKFRQQYYVTTKEAPKKIEYTTFVNREKSACIDLAAKIRETINNERKEKL